MADHEPLKPEEILRSLPLKQDASAAHVVQAPHLPEMEKVEEVKTVARNPLLPLMGGGVAQHPEGEGLMAPVPEGAAETVLRPPQKPQEMKTPPRPQGAAEGGYIRLEVHVENGKLSVVGIRHVPGPLAIPSAVIHGYVYEVLLEDQQIALGSLPDVGVRRAFANRDVAEPYNQHFFIEVPSFDFAARIPRAYFVPANLPKLHVVLHKVEEAPDRFTTLAPLQRQPGVKTVEVGRVVGIRPEQLSPALRRKFEEILKETERPF